MFTDLEGFTADTHEDERGALRLLDQQESLITPIISTHSGRKIKSMGDGLLLEFPNARDAVECAVDLQRSVQEYNAQEGVQPLRIRAGIHLGDVEERGADILGDTVNIASRIEPLSEAGGVCLTAQVYDQVHNKVPYQLERLGPKSLKGIREAVEVYRVVLPWTAGGLPTKRPVLPRLAILPLANISPDPKDEFFADGLTEELISVLSQIEGLRVIARTSVAQYKAASKPVSAIGTELGVTTVMEGSVRKAGSRIRITLQLIDVATQEHLWAESFDRELDDVFAVQTGIAKGVAETLRLRLLPLDRKRTLQPYRPKPEAYSLTLKGRVGLQRANTLEEFKDALQIFLAAIEKDPWYVPAHVGLADCYHSLADRGAPDIDRPLDKAKDAAAAALGLDPDSAEAHCELASVLGHNCDWSGAERELRTALDLNPNLAYAQGEYASFLQYTGRFDEAIEQARRAIDLDPLSAEAQRRAGHVYLAAGRPDEAAAHFRNAVEIAPDLALGHVYLGVCHVLRGASDEGLAELQKGLSLEGGTSAWFLALLAWAHSVTGRPGEVSRIRSTLEARAKEGEHVQRALAATCSAAGEGDQALRWLEAALKEPGGVSPPTLQSVAFDRLRGDPRFQAILRSMGLKPRRSER